MTHHVESKIKVDIPSAKVWEVLSDFTSIERFSATVERSPIISEVKSGIGTQRKCHFYDQSSVIEEITEIDEGQRLRFALSEFSLPLVSIESEMRVKKINETSSEIIMSLDYVVKFGLFGRLLGSLVMPGKMRKMMNNILTGLAYHLKTGRRIGEEMPSNEELTPAITA